MEILLDFYSYKAVLFGIVCERNVSSVLMREDIELQMIVPLLGVGDIQIPAVLIGLVSFKMDYKTFRNDHLGG